MGYQRSFRPSSPACCLRGAALELTGKMRPSTPMSPTCTLFGMPPRAMEKLRVIPPFEFENWAVTVHGRSRTTKSEASDQPYPYQPVMLYIICSRGSIMGIDRIWKVCANRRWHENVRYNKHGWGATSRNTCRLVRSHLANGWRIPLLGLHCTGGFFRSSGSF